MQLNEAQKIAEKYLNLLKPYCLKINIAGGVRREKPDCHDIELVAIPDSWKLEVFLKDSKIKCIKNGEKYKQIILEEGIKLDLFLCNEKTYPTIFLIRTGSANFSHNIMIELRKQNYCCKNGIIYHIGNNCGSEDKEELEEAKGITSEEDIFKLLNMKYLEPKDRK